MRRTLFPTLILALLTLLALVFPAQAARPATTITVDVDLPSPSTGIPDGKLAVRIIAPATPAAARYADGAPVLIWLPGGDGEGSLQPPVRRAEDVIRIVFLFPGGGDPASGRRSDGVYDHRGANSIAALRDVIRYAAGDLIDTGGKTIDQRLLVAVLHDNIGLLGSSNGGNIVIAAPALHGEQLTGHLRYVIQWESPVSSQIATVDAGGVNLDCAGGRRERLNAVNPRYRGYGALALDMDYTGLIYRPADPLHPVFWDGNGDGRYTAVTDPTTGCDTPDLNGDGALGLNEDFPLGAYTDGVKRVYSRPATQALASQAIFGASWPADVATVAEANAYWDLREAVRLDAAAQAKIPGLERMLLASVQDHVQATPDKPHVRQAFEGHPWVKLNPARASVIQVDPGLSGRSDLPDNAANVPPADWTAAASYAYPDGLEETYYAAAIHEMADRAHVAPVTPTPTATRVGASPTPTRTPTATATPTRPAAPAPSLERSVSINLLHGWPAEAGNNLKTYDVAVDEARNRVYVQGCLTSGIAVIDGPAGRLIGRLESGIGDEHFHRTYLGVHAGTGALYVADYYGKTLRRVDPATGALAGPVAVSSGPSHLLVDSATNRVYLSLTDAGKVAVYDAMTLGLVGEVSVAPARPLGMALDSAGGRLLIVDSRPPGGSGQARLLIVNTASLAQFPPIVFPNSTGRPIWHIERDAASGRLFVTTPEELFILTAAGAVEHVTPTGDHTVQVRYWNGKAYVIARNGLSPIRSTLAIVDAATGALEQTLDLGRGGAQRLALNRTTGRLYTPAMEYSDLVVVDTADKMTAWIDLGNGVEDVTVSAGTVYLTNRLGGSTVIAYAAGSGAWHEFGAGGWPTAADVDPALNRLFVLSHYDGAVSAFDLTDPLTPALLAAVPLGLTDTEDALSSQTVDTTRHRVITTHPEHDRVVIVDGQTLTVTATIADVPSFTYTQDIAGTGHLQPAVDEGLNKLYVLARSSRRLDVFDGGAGYAYLRTIDLNSQPWGWSDAFQDHLLRADSARHRLYIGPIIVDTTSDAVVGLLPAGKGDVVAGLDGNRLYTVAEGQPLRLNILDLTTNAVVGGADLRPPAFVPPYLTLDAAGGRFYAAYMQPAEVDIYRLDGAPPPPTPVKRLRLPLLLCK